MGRFAEGPRGPSWYEVFEHLDLIEQDLAHHLGIDLTTALTTRSGRWLKARITALLTLPRIQQPGETGTVWAPASRLAAAL